MSAHYNIQTLDPEEIRAALRFGDPPRPDTFRAIYKPYYHQLAECLHADGLDFWRDTCGNVTELMEDLIEV